MIRLEKITDKNFDRCIQLDPGKAGQDFVAPNVVSLAQAYVAKDNDTCIPMPYAIYNDEVMVGFIMLSYVKRGKDDHIDEDFYEVWRFMMDEQYQGKGYGRQALSIALDILKKFPYGKACNVYLSYVPGNDGGSHLYESVGFKATGDMLDGEILMSYSLR